MEVGTIIILSVVAWIIVSFWRFVVVFEQEEVGYRHRWHDWILLIMVVIGLVWNMFVKLENDRGNKGKV